MKILYFTDLHGDINKYDKVRQLVDKHEIKIIINGGDILPKGGNLFIDQNKFIKKYLDQHFKYFNDKGIYYLNCLGNDDLKIHDELFDQICDLYPFVFNMSQKKIEIFGFEFLGMNWVVDYPFRLKDRCRVDSENFIFPNQFGTGLLSTIIGYSEIKDWVSYVLALPSINNELDVLPQCQNPQKAVYIIHMPPNKLGLGKCYHGEEVGPKAVYNFISRIQPFYALDGHIHESPEVTGKWFNQIGETVCIQPGQSGNFPYVVIDLIKNSFEKYDFFG